ncbi:MAG: Bro-N domain-containing protein [Candidatus Cloacimonetes bacterium]|nr:Bro-N domain-containing protein [Candidatus Cloacimonadota bacterium]
MKKEKSIAIFKKKSIRRHWDEEKELWYFSIIDVVAILTEQNNFQTARKYWNKLKERLKKEGNETVTNCHQLKMLATDGKMRKTDVANTEQLLRLIQSIPSPKAEPFKLWLAKVGYERIEETEDPEKAFDRAMKTYLQKGYSKEWINQRLKSIEVRKELTDEWHERGVEEGLEFAILTNSPCWIIGKFLNVKFRLIRNIQQGKITKAWSGMSIKNYKKYKDLKKENLRDNMTNLELVLNMLAEATTTEISKNKKPETLEENKIIANQGGTIAGNARKEIEEKSGKKVISKKNAKQLSSNKMKEIQN